MRMGIGYPLSAIRECFSTVGGWTAVILASTVVGFSLGYGIGHRYVPAVLEILGVMLWIFVIWIGFPQMFIAYASTALAWYLPIHYESLWLRVAAATLNLIAWVVVVAWVVQLSSRTLLSPW